MSTLTFIQLLATPIPDACQWVLLGGRSFLTHFIAHLPTFLLLFLTTVLFDFGVIGDNFHFRLMSVSISRHFCFTVLL